MRAVVQRVRAAQVLVGEEVVGEVGRGLCVLLGVAGDDDPATAERVAGKVARLRIFENEEGKFDLSVVDVGGGALVVSQFTLIADTAKGNRPSFTAAARPELAEPLYDAFCAALEREGVTSPAAASAPGCSSRSRTTAPSPSCWSPSARPANAGRALLS